MLAAERSPSRGQVRGTGGQGSYCYGNRLDSARPAPRLPSPSLSLYISFHGDIKGSLAILSPSLYLCLYVCGTEKGQQKGRRPRHYHGRGGGGASPPPSSHACPSASPPKFVLSPSPSRPPLLCSDLQALCNASLVLSLPPFLPLLKLVAKAAFPLIPSLPSFLPQNR